MRRMLLLSLTSLAVLAAQGVPARAGGASPRPASGTFLRAELSTLLVFSGITSSEGGRRFSPFPPLTPGAAFQLGEWVNGTPRAYPDRAWNGWRSGNDARAAFVGVNAIRIGPDGVLWVVDTGTRGLGRPTVPGGPKLVRIDVRANHVVRVYPLEHATRSNSYVDDVRFGEGRAYLTDAGALGLIVLDLRSGQARRVLDADRSVTQRRVLRGEGKPLRDPRGQPVRVNADQIELSPDGRFLYHQPCTGPLYRIATRWLDDPAPSDRERVRHVTLFASTGNTGGSAMDAAGNIYISDTDALAVRKITPQGRVSTVVQDSRLVWVDAMWIDGQGNLWLPANQLNRTRGLNGGVSALRPPLVIYRLPIGVRPLRR